ncbi:hypothetical protein, partial [Streptomyces fructofermentans]|uniref:hypothetical protein n=1 Tax=Streptomyces fructofermentans TaxID=152141 RepID=UPI0037910911
MGGSGQGRSDQKRGEVESGKGRGITAPPGEGIVPVRERRAVVVYVAEEVVVEEACGSGILIPGAEKFAVAAEVCVGGVVVVGVGWVGLCAGGGLGLGGLGGGFGVTGFAGSAGQVWCSAGEEGVGGGHGEFAAVGRS